MESCSLIHRSKEVYEEIPNQTTIYEKQIEQILAQTNSESSRFIKSGSIDSAQCFSYDNAGEGGQKKTTFPVFQRLY